MLKKAYTSFGSFKKPLLKEFGIEKTMGTSHYDIDKWIFANKDDKRILMALLQFEQCFTRLSRWVQTGVNKVLLLIKSTNQDEHVCIHKWKASAFHL